MPNNDYKKAIDNIRFSKDVENDILKSIHSQNTSSQAKQKHKAFIITFSCIIILLLFYLKWNYQENNIFDINNLVAEDGMSSISVASITIHNDLSLLDNIEIGSGEMLIIDNSMNLNEGEKSFLFGTFSEKNLKYDVGYIYDGTYVNIVNSEETPMVNHSISSTEAGLYYWCIINKSADSIYLNGKIEISSNHLLHKDYGKDTIEANQSCKIIVNGISSILDNDNLEGIYLLNCQKQSTIKLSTSVTDIIYEVTEPGTYIIYALTNDGDTINLRNYTKIEYSIKEDQNIFGP